MISTRAKNLYKGVGLTDFNFFQKKITTGSRRSGTIEKIIPGFFTPYQSISDFINQLIAPLFTPVICIIEAGIQALKCLKELFCFAVRLATLDLNHAWSHAGKIAYHGEHALFYVMNTVVDCMYSLVALITRSISSLGAVIGAITTALGITANVVDEPILNPYLSLEECDLALPLENEDAYHSGAQSSL